LQLSTHIPIRVSTLRGDQPIRFDAFVRVAGKYILFCREGDSFEDQRLERLKSKKLQKMWILKEQEHNYRAYLRENIARAYEGNANRPLEIRTQIIQGLLQASAEDLMEDLANDGNYKIALESAKQFKIFLDKEPHALDSLLRIKNNEQNIAHHGVNVSSLALGIATELGLTESRPMQMDTLVVGCLIHDVEHNFNNLSLQKDPSELSRNEFEIYVRHADEGANRIRKYFF
jgi:HD-GYP domain-containing protein (c-di-GMP phosphodiesterase class II)